MAKDSSKRYAATRRINAKRKKLRKTQDFYESHKDQWSYLMQIVYNKNKREGKINIQNKIKDQKNKE